MIQSDFVKVLVRNKKYPTVIAFSSVNTPKGKFKPYRIVETADVNIIFVNDDGNRWYQNGIHGVSGDSEEAAKTLVDKAREIGNGKVITFGTSMGAFGAILFAILGNADACLAFGVESVLREKGSRSDQYLRKNTAVKYPDLSLLIQSSDIKISLFGSENDELDLISLYRLMKFENVHLFTLRGADHPSIQALDVDGRVGKLITQFANNEVMDFKFERVGELLNTSKIIPCLYEAYKIKTVTKNFGKWLSFLEENKSLYTNSSLYMLRLGEARYRNRDSKGAEEAWRQSIYNGKFQFESMSKLGSLIRRNGQIDKAISLLEESVRINPWHAHGLHGLGLAYQDNHEMEKAENCFRRAVSINNGNKDFKKSLGGHLILMAQIKMKEANEVLQSIK